MCIMEIRPGQHSSTMQQACTHNLGTVLSDLEMFARILDSRDPEMAGTARETRTTLQGIYDQMCEVYGEMVAKEVEHLTDYTLHQDHEHGNERLHWGDNPSEWPSEQEQHEAHSHDLPSPAEIARVIAEQDIHRARKYETR